MNRIAILAFAAALTAASCTEKTAAYRIVPEPASITPERHGRFTWRKSSEVTFADSALAREAAFVSSFIKEEAGRDVECRMAAPADGNIVLDIDPGLPLEGYLLEIGRKQVRITGGSAAGVFYGGQTFRKCMASDSSLPSVRIQDWPVFGYRGAHLDVSRHLFTADEVKQYIDMMALHDMNRLHLHLTDDQGWRIEIKKYPKLTEIGSVRKESLLGRLSDEPRVFDGKPHGGFYTQDEIRDLVNYAADRHIEIIPEIDLPGHMVAALASYPELGCTGGPYDVWTVWGISDDVLCAGKPEVYDFLENVFAEVMDLFPSGYIHIGGDECPKSMWKKCPRCQALMRKLGLADDGIHTKEQKLQSYMMGRISDFITAHGRKVIGWDEMLEGGAAEGSTIMSWRGEDGGITAAEAGHDVVMTPTTYLYFDYYQSQDTENEPMAIGGYVPVEKVYGYNPVPDVLDSLEATHIIGVQANLWTEYIDNFRKVQYMVLPRWAALSEIQWRNSTDRDYGRFMKDIIPLLDIYDKNGYTWARHIFDVSAEYATDSKAHTVDVTLNSAGAPEIRYTLDGSEPDSRSMLYVKTLKLDADAKLRATAFRDGTPGKVLAEDICCNKATARKAELLTVPSRNYTFGGASMLVDGLRGNTMFTSGRWLGFADGTPFTAVLDMEIPVDFSSVGVGTCICTRDGIFGTRRITVSVSDDGKEFRDVASADYEQVTEDTATTVTHTLTFAPVKARFIRVNAESQGDVPSWSWLAGTKAWLFIDELIVK